MKPLPTKKIMATAHQVAQNFKDLTNQLNNDLSIGKRLETEKAKSCCTNETRTRNGSQKRQGTSQSQSVWFTVEVDGNNAPAKSQKPALSARKKKALTAEDIEEKQWKAEERRNVCHDTKWYFAVFIKWRLDMFQTY